MDIVKSRIENLSGSVDVRTAPGQGTTFTIRLPLTLAIMSSLLVRIYERDLRDPAGPHRRDRRGPPAAGLPGAGPADHRDPQEDRRPGRRSATCSAGAASAHPRPSAARARSDGRRHDATDEPDKLSVVIVQNGETTIGLLVDQLIGMQEVVLKSLEKNFRADPRPLRRQHPGRRPGLADPRRRRPDHHGGGETPREGRGRTTKGYGDDGTTKG